MTPDHVNFDEVANEAITAGLFALDPAAARSNLLIIGKYGKLPATLLDAPYGNGPIAIREAHEDVPEAAVYAVRRNVTEANRLLLPPERVLVYFHQRFVADDVFRSASLATLVGDYQSPRVDEYHDSSLDAVLGTRVKAVDVSFRTDGVDRTTHDRRLYTRDEHTAALRLAQDHPEVVLAILAYQSVLLDYLGGVRNALADVARERRAAVTPKDLSDFDAYIEQWKTSNFTDELVPALAIFHQQRVKAGVSAHAIIDRELFQYAVDFIITNGAFRNWVTVSAETARNHTERVDHFLCPAVGVIREHLLDGSLLQRIHGIVRDKHRRKDRRVATYLKHISAEAALTFRKNDLDSSDEDLARIQQPLELTVNGQVYRIELGPEFVQFMRGSQQGDDVVLEGPAGSWLYDLLNAAVSASMDWNAAVFFSANGQGYRVTPARIEAYLERVRRTT